MDNNNEESLGRFLSEMVADARANDAVQRASQDAAKAIAGVMSDEYTGMHLRAIENDHLLTPEESPGLDVSARSFVLHTLAAGHAKAIAKLMNHRDMGQHAEYHAQMLEHRAALSRWSAKLARAVQ